MNELREVDVVDLERGDVVRTSPPAGEVTSTADPSHACFTVDEVVVVNVDTVHVFIVCDEGEAALSYERDARVTVVVASR